MSEVVARRPAGQMLAFFGLNCLGSGFWIKHGIDAHMPGLFIASAAASVVASAVLAVIEPETRERWKQNTRKFFAKPLHNMTGVPTIIAGLKGHDAHLIVLGACTIGGSLYAVWGDGFMRATKADRLMKALKLDKIPVLNKIPVFETPDAMTAAFLIYLGVIPAVLKDAAKLTSPYLAAAGACYTMSIASIAFRRRSNPASAATTYR